MKQAFAREKPWDATIAAWMLRPIARFPLLHPNHFTGARLITGIYGSLLFATGSNNLTAALFFVLSNFLDHFDGELARMTNRSSKFGHYFDLISDFIVTSGAFFCIGFGFYTKNENPLFILMGVFSGLSIMATFHMRHLIESKEGKKGTIQPSAFGFEAEDVLYFLPAIVFFDSLELFLLLASIGAPIAMLLVLTQLKKNKEIS